MHFDPATRACDFSNGAQDTPSDIFSWIDFICLTPFFKNSLDW